MKHGKSDFKGNLTIVLTFFAFIVGANEFSASRKERDAEAADIAYSRLLQNLGSDSAVVRIGTIGQIARQIRRKVPILHHPYPWDGIAYLFGLNKPETSHPYHEDLQSIIRALLTSPKDGTDSALESAAIISLLCDLGPEGWYAAGDRHVVSVSSDSIRWIWENAPEARLSDAPSYTLFRGAELAHASFARLQMERAEFTGATLMWTSFAGSYLDNSTFTTTKLNHVTFEGASLRGADFGGAILDDVNFNGADLDNAHFEGADLKEVRFIGARNIGRAAGLNRVIAMEEHVR